MERAAGESAKVLTFVRHGVAAHNFRDAQDPDPDEPARYTDSPLTDYGRAQAAATATSTPALECEMLVVAPLSRAIETGLLAFPSVSKVVAHEAVREYAARRYANKRRTRTELQVLFGDKVDFAMIGSDEDPLFNPEEAEPWPAGPVARYAIRACSSPLRPNNVPFDKHNAVHVASDCRAQAHRIYTRFIL